MIAIIVAAISLAVPLSTTDAVALVPGDGVGLDSVSPAVSRVHLPAPTAPPNPTPRPYGFGGLAGMAVLGGAVVTRRSTRRRRSTEPVYVLVHGYGGSPSDFDDLLALLGVDRSDTVAFDYRDVVARSTSGDASKVAGAEEAARRLDDLIRGLSSRYENIYSLHHSKGGAVGVSMIASLDDGTRPPIDGYRGAALLDPAIGSGLVGSMQRLGSFARVIPDNGGFDPIQCRAGTCRDTREHLGEASGVEVIAIRNPDALITNFTDEPEHLRVYDLINDGGGSAMFSLWSPVAFAGRIAEAHRSVLEDWAVADCIKAEVARSGSCVWKGSTSGRRPIWGSGNAKNVMR